MLVATLVLLLVIGANSIIEASKVVDFGSKLPDFVKQHPDKRWLIKFYAPWCYHCQQLEPIYNNVAERIYHKHDNLVVGRVDCTKSPATCEQYNVQAYPSIIFLSDKSAVKYKGERTENAIIEFAERLSGPDIKVVDDCDHLRRVVNQHGHIVLSTERNLSSELHEQFKKLASSHKESWWFYYMSKACEKSTQQNGLYIMKRNMRRALKFQVPQEEKLKDTAELLNDWLLRESFPLYSKFSSLNHGRALNSDKMLVIAILDEYKPAKILSKTSKDLHETMDTLSRNFAQHDDDLLFLWSSDLDLINSIAISRVPVPNVMLLKPDFRYQLLISDEAELEHAKSGKDVSRLQRKSIEKFITVARLEDHKFKGGNSYVHSFCRAIYSQYYKFIKLYQGDPLLVSILMIFPACVVLFVLYSTCFGDDVGTTSAQDTDSDDEVTENLNEESRRLIGGHKKQD